MTTSRTQDERFARSCVWTKVLEEGLPFKRMLSYSDYFGFGDQRWYNVAQYGLNCDVTSGQRYYWAPPPCFAYICLIAIPFYIYFGLESTAKKCENYPSPLTCCKTRPKQPQWPRKFAWHHFSLNLFILNWCKKSNSPDQSYLRKSTMVSFYVTRLRLLNLSDQVLWTLSVQTKLICKKVT